MKHILEETDISLTNIHDTIHLSSPPWLLKQPVVILDLNKLPKNKTHPLIYQEKLNNIQEIYPNYQHIYTDGSKSNFGTGCGAVLHKKSLKKCLPKEASLFSAEIYAINMEFDLISTSSSKKKKKKKNKTKKNYHPLRLHLSSSIPQIYQIGKSANYQDLQQTQLTDP